MYAHLSLKHFWYARILSHMKGAHSHIMVFDKTFISFWARPPSAVGSESNCESRGRWFEPRSGNILSLRFGNEKKIYDRSHVSAVSRRAVTVVSYW